MDHKILAVMDEYQPILLRWFINSAHILKREAHQTICRNFRDLGRVFYQISSINRIL